MRDLTTLDRFRLSGKELWGWDGDGTCGAFRIKSKTSPGRLHVIASSGDGWDHVSVSREDRTPTWAEMEQIKRLFFKDDETAVQFHVPPSAHINHHKNCLHLWRWLGGEFPRPPAILV